MGKGAKPPTALFARRMEQCDIDAQRKAYGGPKGRHSRAPIRAYPRSGALSPATPQPGRIKILFKWFTLVKHKVIRNA